jgi:hypothetical protein
LEELISFMAGVKEGESKKHSYLTKPLSPLHKLDVEEFKRLYEYVWENNNITSNNNGFPPVEMVRKLAREGPPAPLVAKVEVRDERKRGELQERENW